MTELEYLDQQELAVSRRLRANLLLEDNAATEFIERAADEHPFLTVGGVLGAGGLVGLVLGKASTRQLAGILKWCGPPLLRVFKQSR